MATTRRDGEAARAEAHARLDALLDAQERAANANDPDARMEAEEQKHQAFLALMVPLVGTLYATRQGAAMTGRRPDEIRGDHDKAAALGAGPIGPNMLRDPDGRVAVRRALARFALDFAPMLAPGLANSFAAEMFQLNQGGPAAWLTRPAGLKGVPKAKGLRSIADVTLLCRAYYHAGYDRIAVEEAARQDNDNVGRDWQSLVRARQSLNLLETCHVWKAQGAADRAVGRPRSVPIMPDYDLTEGARLLRDLVAGRVA